MILKQITLMITQNYNERKLLTEDKKLKNEKRENRMRKVTLTSKNINMVLHLLKKFFNNKKYGFESYHNFDCGWKNFKPYHGGIKSLDKDVDAIEIDFDLFTGDPYIRIAFQKGVSGTVLYVGSVIKFKGGSQITTQCEWIMRNSFNFVYTTYRLKKLSLRDTIRINEHRKFELEYSNDYWSSVENEYNEECEYAASL